MVAEHVRSLVFVDYADLQSPGILAKGFYFLTGFGHEAVMVFFVISGYLVGGKVWSLYRNRRFGWPRYLVDRLSRLYAVLFVALVLGAVLDWSGYWVFNSYGLYNKGYAGQIAVLGTDPFDRMGWQDFLANAFFLQTIAGPPFGSNGPLWSLAYEWWYYILFPALLLVVFRKGFLGVTAGVVLTLLLLFVLHAEIIWLFGIWLLGVAAATVSQGTLAQEEVRTTEEKAKSASGNALGATLKSSASDWRRFFLAFSVFLFLGILLLARIEISKVPYAWQFMLGFAYALVIVSLAGCKWRFPWYRLSACLAEFSYSVYLIHFPVLMFMLSVAFEISGFGIRMPFGAVGFCWYSLVFVVAILASWLISLFTESKTTDLRSMLYRLFRVSRDL